MQIDTSDMEEKKDSDVAVICSYCNVSFIGPPHVMKINHDTFEISGALYNHWRTSCSDFNKYHMKLKSVAVHASKHS
jgi:hypothetical protein